MALRLLIAAVALASASCATAPPTEAQRVRALESRVWSPYCPGRVLTDCSTRQSAELREEIARRVADGQTDAQVVAWLRSNYGDEVLAAPAPDRRGTLIWLVPLAVLGAGALLVGGVVRRWSGKAADTAPDAAAEPVPEEERDRWIARVRDEVAGDID
ncbi:MAG TPA: cytochrome c-type biogenesis protein CcmH [Actinomycetota bacterium]|nr:cytochrome c-type biogenesis protein CcmH [Actinomycetota bacterium]